MSDTLETRQTGHILERKAALEAVKLVRQLFKTAYNAERLSVFGYNYVKNFQKDPEIDELTAIEGMTQDFPLNPQSFDEPIALGPHDMEWFVDQKLASGLFVNGYSYRAITEFPPKALTKAGVVACNMVTIDTEAAAMGRHVPVLREPFKDFDVLTNSSRTARNLSAT